MKEFGCIFAFIFALGANAAPTKSPPWVSIYNGSEEAMSSKDRSRILAILDTFGVNYKNSGKKIKVPAGTHRATLELVSKFWTHSNPEEKTKEINP